MNNRFINFPALVLLVKEQGESNREAYLLSAEAGIIRAVLYGGPKSKLRSHVSPFHSGVVYLYFNPVRDSYKLSDFDVQKWRPGLREDFDRAMRAAALCETVLACKGGGCNWPEALNFANASLDALENAGKKLSQRIILHFLWNWAEILGVRPDFSPAEGQGNLYTMNPGALRWLKTIESLEPSDLERYDADETSLSYAKTLCIEILSSALGRKLKSWQGI